MATISPNQCTYFVQIWVDVNALQQNSTAGCYAVANNPLNCTGEGTGALMMKVPTGSYVCWSVVPIDPQYNNIGGNLYFQITNIGVQSGWAAPPQQYLNEANVFTGQLIQSAVGGNVDSNVIFSYNNGGQSITVTLPIVIVPYTA